LRRGYTELGARKFCLLILVVLVSWWSMSWGMARAGSPYDRPLRVRHVNLKPDPLNAQVKRNITCFDYDRFVVKQIDFGEVGAESLSIIPVGKEGTVPCRQTRERQESVISSDSWSGYFKGAKSDCCIFTAADGINGGLGFMVFSASGKKKLFEDIAEKGIESIDTAQGRLKLRYQRVFASKCSAVTEGAACRDTIAGQTGVSVESLLPCAGSYEAAKREMAKTRCESERTGYGLCMEKELKVLDGQHWEATPTVIVYEVEAVLGGKQPVIKPLGNVLVCRPAD
jgi:hypothetical protein